MDQNNSQGVLWELIQKKNNTMTKQRSSSKHATIKDSGRHLRDHITEGAKAGQTGALTMTWSMG